eukprot:5300467-Amphidinium_carterae.1
MPSEGVPSENRDLLDEDDNPMVLCLWMVREPMSRGLCTLQPSSMRQSSPPLQPRWYLLSHHPHTPEHSSPPPPPTEEPAAALAPPLPTGQAPAPTLLAATAVRLGRYDLERQQAEVIVGEASTWQPMQQKENKTHAVVLLEDGTEMETLFCLTLQ